MKFPGGGNIAQLMAQASRMQADMKKLQQELAVRELEHSSAGGRIKVKVNGKQEILGLEISAEILDPQDPALASDMIKIAVNEAIKKSQDMVNSEMSRVVPPGLAGMF
jgi:DNA-binding YbaB/EbfC family protein